MPRTDRRLAPLRLVVREEMEEVIPGVSRRVEVLECGHRQRIRKDHMGPTNAYRRRCLICLREQERR